MYGFSCQFHLNSKYITQSLLYQSNTSYLVTVHIFFILSLYLNVHEWDNNVFLSESSHTKHQSLIFLIPPATILYEYIDIKTYPFCNNHCGVLFTI